MIFLTMGTYPLPFDRLVKAIDELVRDNLIEDEIIAQIGCSNYIPQYMKYVLLMEKEAFDEAFSKADALIGHAGMGTITMALEHKKPLLVMPRLAKYKEHVNDHQLGTAIEFERMGHVLAAYENNELPEKIKHLKMFVPSPRSSQADKVALFISEFLNRLK